MTPSMKLLIFGPPGSGKGTFAELFCQRTHITPVSTGNIFRKHIAEQDELGKQVKELIDAGKLVPDELTNEIVKQRLTQEDVKESFLLDGYPRTLKQAEFLMTITDLTGVILLTLTDDEIVQRLSRRRVCPACGVSYHLDLKPPQQEGVCDLDAEQLIQREDDTPHVILSRLQTYKEETQPIIDFLRTKGVSVKEMRGDYDIKSESQGLIDSLVQWQISVAQR